MLAANPRTARGFSGDLILDEFAFHENGDAIWAAAEPILASNKDFLCRIASTGNGRHNLFYRMVEGELTTDGHGETRMGGEGIKNEKLKVKNGEEEHGKHLSPSQWLPKPATSQFPHKRRALRATWSPRLRRAERGMIVRWDYGGV